MNNFNANPNQNIGVGMNFMGMNNPMGGMMNNPMGMGMNGMGMNNPMAGMGMNNPMGGMGMNNPMAGMGMNIPMAGMGMNIPFGGMMNNPMAMGMNGMGMNNPMAGMPMGMNMQMNPMMNNPMGGMGNMILNPQNNQMMMNFMNNGMKDNGNIQNFYANSHTSSSTSSNTGSQGSQELKSVLPRVILDQQENFGAPTNPNIRNIRFDASTGIKVLLKMDKNTTVQQLLNEFVKKLGLSQNVIGKDLIFLFNGGKLDTNSQETISKFQDFSTITVFDQNNVIGAY